MSLTVKVTVRTDDVIIKDKSGEIFEIVPKAKLGALTKLAFGDGWPKQSMFFSAQIEDDRVVLGDIVADQTW